MTTNIPQSTVENRRLTLTKILEPIEGDIAAIIARGEYQKGDPEVARIAQFLRRNSVEIRELIGLLFRDPYQVQGPSGLARTVTQHSDIRCCNKLFKFIGLKPHNIRTEGKRGHQVRVWAVSEGGAE